MSIKTDEFFYRNTKTSPFSSDSEQKATHRVAPQAIAAQDTKELDRIIAEVNARLDQGEQVDLTQYPPLFVVHYRGTHFFRQFADHQARHDVRTKIQAGQFKAGIYSPACYELAGIPLGAPIDTPEKKRKMYDAVRLLSEQFETLASSPCTERDWWGKQAKHETLLFQHYQRYVNTYEAFRTESSEKTRDCYQVLDSTKTPYVSTADHPRHALMYALGAKSDLTATPLRPGYDASLKPKHPKVGYVQIIFHRLTSLAKAAPLPLSTLHASKKISIGPRILNERETTYRAAVSEKHVMATCITRFPAMNMPFRKGLHDTRYGFTDRSYDTYKNSLQKKTKKSKFFPILVEHMQSQLAAQAEKIASDKKGYVVYLGLDGRLSRHLPATIEITHPKDPTSLYEQFQENLSLYAHSLPSSDEYPELQEQEDADKVNESMRVPVDGANNCFYAAILHQIRERIGSTDYDNVTEMDMQKSCINEINANYDLYAVFKGQNKGLQDVVNTEYDSPYSLMIYAMANALNLRIVILVGGNTKIFNPRKIPVTSAYLYYDSTTGRYDSLLPLPADETVEDLNKDLENLAISPTPKMQQPADDRGYDGDDDKTKAKAVPAKATKGQRKK